MRIKPLHFMASLTLAFYIAGAQGSLLPSSSVIVSNNASLNEDVLPHAAASPAKMIKKSKNDLVYLLGARVGSVFSYQLNDDVKYTLSGVESVGYKVRYDFRPGTSAELSFGGQYKKCQLTAGMGYLTLDSDQVVVYDANDAVMGFRSLSTDGDAGIGDLHGRYEFVHFNYLLTASNNSFQPYIGAGAGRWHYKSDAGNQLYGETDSVAKDDLAFIQARVGMHYSVSSQISSDVGYQYRMLNPIELEYYGTDSGANTRFKIDEHSAMQDLTFGLYFSF